MPHHPSVTPLPFDVLADAFALLTTGPHPLALSGGDVVGLPARVVPLDELRSWLLHPSCPYDTRDAAINLLLDRAASDGGAWTVGLIGVLLPGLRRAAGPLLAACPHRAADIQAEILTGLLAAIASTPAGRPRVAARLTWAARRAADRLVRTEIAERARPGRDPIGAEPPRPYGHPDLVLARAVAAGVICADDAELIGATRLGGQSLADAARAWGLTYPTASRRRARAEAALVAWIRDGDASEFVANPGRRPGSSGVGRPRQGRRPGQAAGCANPTADQTRAWRR